MAQRKEQLATTALKHDEGRKAWWLVFKVVYGVGSLTRRAEG